MRSVDAQSDRIVNNFDLIMVLIKIISVKECFHVDDNISSGN